ncbi:MAG TPA: enoyl-CoA hydratase/isomerase family protein [Sphingobium sp.]|uniref:enoyl-CoA hydratase/isomerase family protein n=1 Tax=Sphingobium sp. TaxID=1912891 RepID=UPI002ED0DAB7
MQFDDYATRYQTIRFSRSEDGVLEMTLHTRGGEALWGTSEASLHRELGLAFADIARDPANKVVVLTGTGETFCAGSDPEERAAEPSLAKMWDRIFEEGVAFIENLLAIPVPVIAAVNGPALIHAELAVLSDIVLAADHAEFADMAHMPYAVPGDGVQAVWLMLLGPNRGRYFLLTNERIGAEEAKRLGVVGEVLPREALMPRARELAANLAKLPVKQLRHTRRIMVRELRRRLRDELELGLAVEALATLN